jgi:hypothetical protein
MRWGLYYCVTFMALNMWLVIARVTSVDRVKDGKTKKGVTFCCCLRTRNRLENMQ